MASLMEEGFHIPEIAGSVHIYKREITFIQGIIKPSRRFIFTGFQIQVSFFCHGLQQRSEKRMDPGKSL